MLWFISMSCLIQEWVFELQKYLLLRGLILLLFHFSLFLSSLEWLFVLPAYLKLLQIILCFLSLMHCQLPFEFCQCSLCCLVISFFVYTNIKIIPWHSWLFLQSSFSIATQPISSRSQEQIMKGSWDFRKGKTISKLESMNRSEIFLGMQKVNAPFFRDR